LKVTGISNVRTVAREWKRMEEDCIESQGPQMTLMLEKNMTRSILTYYGQKHVIIVRNLITVDLIQVLLRLLQSITFFVPFRTFSTLLDVCQHSQPPTHWSLEVN
jgi:hypothetical protein